MVFLKPLNVIFCMNLTILLAYSNVLYVYVTEFIMYYLSFWLTGFAPDVKVWEVKFSKLGEFQQLSRVFELTGHSSGVYDVGFSADSSRMVTVSKDGTWRAFNTKSKEHFYLYTLLKTII